MSNILHKELSYKITGFLFEVHKKMGRFRNEKQYSDYFENLLKDSKLKYEREYRFEDHGYGQDKVRCVCDFIVDDKGNVEQFLAEKEESLIMTHKLKGFEKTLKERDLFIYKKRLVAEKPMTLQTIANKYKISKERARQLEEKIKNNLKVFLS